MELDLVGYLQAKEKIDDRSINREVWSELRSDMARTAGPLRVMELGCGTGAMLRRVLGDLWQWDVEYTGIDFNPKLLNAAPSVFERWAKLSGFDYSPGIEVMNDSHRASINLVKMDVYQGFSHLGRDWSLVLAHAFLDLVDLPTILPQILGRLRPGGWFYFTLNFDGVTQFLPTIDDRLDRAIIRHYHHSMNARLHAGKQSGHSQTGRRLLAALRAAGVQIITSGPSDWFIYPRQGRYPDHEHKFLLYILQFIENQLINHPELDQQAFRDWLGLRAEQIGDGELVYIARQLDVAGRVE